MRNSLNCKLIKTHQRLTFKTAVLYQKPHHLLITTGQKSCSRANLQSILQPSERVFTRQSPPRNDPKQHPSIPSSTGPPQGFSAAATFAWTCDIHSYRSHHSRWFAFQKIFVRSFQDVHPPYFQSSCSLLLEQKHFKFKRNKSPHPWGNMRDGL